MNFILFWVSIAFIASNMGSQVSNDDNTDNTNYYQVWGYLPDDPDVPKHIKFADWLSFVDAEQMRKGEEKDNAIAYTDGMMTGNNNVKIVKYYTRRRGDPTWLLYTLGFEESSDTEQTERTEHPPIANKRLYGMYFDERSAQDKLEMMSNVLRGLNERNGTTFTPILETRDDREIRGDIVNSNPLITPGATNPLNIIAIRSPSNIIMRIQPPQMTQYIGRIRNETNPVHLREVGNADDDTVNIRGLDEPSVESGDESSDDQINVFHSPSGLDYRFADRGNPSRPTNICDESSCESSDETPVCQYCDDDDCTSRRNAQRIVFPDENNESSDDETPNLAPVFGLDSSSVLRGESLLRHMRMRSGRPLRARSPPARITRLHNRSAAGFFIDHPPDFEQRVERLLNASSQSGSTPDTISTNTDSLQEWFDRLGEGDNNSNSTTDDSEESSSEDLDQLFARWAQRRHDNNRHGSGRIL